MPSPITRAPIVVPTALDGMSKMSRLRVWRSSEGDVTRSVTLRFPDAGVYFPFNLREELDQFSHLLTQARHHSGRAGDVYLTLPVLNYYYRFENRDLLDRFQHELESYLKRPWA